MQGSLDLVPLIIEGRMAGSRFGFTIANLGDIDRDGHEGKTKEYT